MAEKKYSPKLGKRKLADRVGKIHKSTKTSFWRLTRAHDWLRGHVHWYYRWHLWKGASLVHWLILLASIVFLVFSANTLVKTNRENAGRQEDWMVVGQKAFEKAQLINVEIIESKAEVLDKERGIGIVRVKKGFEGPATWKTIDWDANVPPGTSLVLKTRFSDEDSEAAWEGTHWSDFYSTPGPIIDELKNPSPRAKYLEAEVVLQGKNGESPTLNWIKISYIPYQRPGGAGYFIAEKIVNFGVFLYNKIEKRFGHTF